MQARIINESAKMVGACALIVVTCAFAAFPSVGQSPAAERLDHITLYSPFVFSKHDKRRDTPQWDTARASKSCLDFRSLTYGKCPAPDTLVYGNRFGDLRAKWDFFSLEIGPNTQTRILDLGDHGWNDNLEIPYIRPYARLRAGEIRKLSINTWGIRSADGKTYSSMAHKVDTQRVTSAGTFEEDYAPYLDAEVGHIYAVRVLDLENDFYVLLRVDRVDHGVSADLSFKKVPSPRPPVF